MADHDARQEAASQRLAAASAGHARQPTPRRQPKGPWRAWDTFVWSLGAACLLTLALMAASAYQRATGGFTGDGAERLLGILRNVTYPLVFVALGALAWHYVKFYQGAYARR